MQKIIVFGITGHAQEIKSYVENDDAAIVSAYVVDSQYKMYNQIDGIPIIDFERITDHYPPNEYQLMLVIGYSNMNSNRKDKFKQCKDLGYTLFTFISKDSNVYTKDIGEGCLILPGCTVAPFVSLGCGNILGNGVAICHHTKVKNFNYFAPRSTICGDVSISNNCFFGAGCTVGGELTIDDYTLVAAGATLMQSTKKKQVYFPAKTILWRGTSDEIVISKGIDWNVKKLYQ